MLCLARGYLQQLVFPNDLVVVLDRLANSSPKLHLNLCRVKSIEDSPEQQLERR